MEKDFKSIRYNVTIKIEEPFITFYRTDALKAFNNWFNTLNERQIEDLDEEQKECHYFYWIGTEDWIDDYNSKRIGNFQEHMMKKSWFTQEMLDWINKQLIK